MQSGVRLEFESIRGKVKEEFRFFKTLTNDEIEQFLHFCEFRSGLKGENLWEEGDTDNYAAFILSGKLGIKKKTEFDKYMIVGTFAKGTVAGELCLLTNRNRSVTAVILEDIEILRLASEDFERLISDYPMLGLKLLRHIFLVISNRLNRSTSRIASIF
jgi:CRP/FNR family cyclic AMP-dependent transcriptional regulator